MYVSETVHMSAGTRGDEKMALEALELELQVVVSSPM